MWKARFTEHEIISVHSPSKLVAPLGMSVVKPVFTTPAITTEKRKLAVWNPRI